MKIEPLSLCHLQKIVDLQKNFFSDGWTEEMLNAGFKENNLKGFVAIEGEKIIAFITYSLTQDYSDLLDILVHPDFRGQSIAQELMRKYLAEIKDKTQKSLLEVRQSNEKAISLYNKFGYNTISTRKKYYEDGENALIMQKEI